MFGLIIAGRAVDTSPTALSETSYIFPLPSFSSINHLTIFLLPGTPFPATHAATIHLQLPATPNNPSPQSFRLLGAIGPNKPSAVFRLKDVTADPQHNTGVMGGMSGVPGADEGVLGISIEEVGVVEQQLAAKEAAKQAAGGVGGGRKVSDEVLQKVAQKIIVNCWNYLGGFVESAPGGEVVRMRRFKEWWDKFEGRVKSDPGFLERD